MGSPATNDVHQQETELREFIENAPVAMHRADQGGTILWANAAELNLLGYAPNDYIGRNIAEFYAAEPVILHDLPNDEMVHRQEARLRCKDGSTRTVEIISSIHSEQGRIVYLHAVMLDVTEQRRALELQNRLAAIVESSDDAIISKDMDGIIRSWNRGAERIFGYKSDEIVGKHISTLAAPDRVDEFPDILGRLRRGERIDHYETKRRTKDGRILDVSLTVSPIRDAHGTVIGASKVARDISEPRRALELHERLAAIVESSEDAIVSKDLNGIIQSWNSGAERLFGYTSDEVAGKPITIIIPPDRLGEEPEILGRLQRGERVDHFETIRKRKDGVLLNISLTISPVKDAQGKVVGASKVARDITGRKRQEQALEAAHASLMEANADLQQFAYSASHDLQEPLRMVSIYGELLVREFGDKLGPSGAEYVGHIVQGAARMEQLLKALRAFTVVSSRGKEPTEHLDSGQVLDKALANLEVAIRDSGASITRTALPSVRIHEFQLEQLFQNLIANSIRYRGSDPPRIHVAAHQQHGDWLFSVQDNGIGIEPQYKEQVFGMFKRLHTAAEYPGTGMGLAICQRIVERVGGRIWVESEPGRGATFFFTIPRSGQ